MAVIEMGANHQKEIAGYCEYAQPTHGIITNCGKAHLEGFGGVQGVKLAEQTTRDGALEALFNVRPELTGTEEAPTELGLLVKKIIDDKKYRKISKK